MEGFPKKNNYISPSCHTSIWHMIIDTEMYRKKLWNVKKKYITLGGKITR